MQVIVKKLLVLLIVLLILFFLGLTFFNQSSSPFSINTSRPAVVEKLQALNRIETASFTIEKIIDAGTNGGTLKNFFFGDRLLLVAHGEIIAGFDLTKLTKDNITVQGKSITVNLPAPEILISKLDNTQTRVYDRQQGLLTHGNKDLEAKARNEAEKSIRQAACEEGVLNEASKNGKNELTVLLKSFGFTSVTINAASGSCQ